MVRRRGLSFDPYYTFENFVVGHGNLEMVGVARQIAGGGPVAIGNPIVFWGYSGLGKTHLLHAIGNEALARDPKARVRRVPPSEKLVLHIRQMKAADIALFESVHFYPQPYCGNARLTSGQRAGLRAFNEVFEFLLKKKRCIVFEADRPPDDLRELGLRLPRTAVGIEIKPPDLDSRVAILKLKAERHLARQLRDDVALLIAKPIDSNVRALEGAVNRLRKLDGRITPRCAREALQDMLSAYETQSAADK